MTVGNQSSRISEILQAIVGQSQNSLQNQSLEDLSPVRKKSLMIFQKLDLLSDRYVTSPLVKPLKPTITRYVEGIIRNKITDDELKKVMYECYQLLAEDFQEVQIAQELNNELNKDLNAKLKVSMPKYKELAELL